MKIFNIMGGTLRASIWAPLFASLLSGYLVGLASAVFFANVVFDAGLATLLGSALGAGITVAGSLWIARYQLAARERSFGRFTADAAAAIRNEAYILIALLEIEDWGDNGVYAAKIKRQVQFLNEATALFERNSPFSDIGDYEARLWITRLEGQVMNGQRVLDKELKWLDRPTDAVLENSRADLTQAAQSIFEACVAVNRELKHKRELPDKVEVQRRLALLED
jgi:hypothetical protein